MRRLTPNLGLGIAVVVLALLALFLWVPNDTVSGLIQSKRGRVSIGDGMAPALAFGLMIIAGVLILLEARDPEAAGRLERRSFRFLGLALGLCVIALTLMIWTGPLAVAVLRDEETYRNLRDTAPWKHLGFVLGGITLVAGLIALVENRLTLRAVLIALATVLCLIGMFDLAFDDLLLPPNGDQ